MRPSRAFACLAVAVAASLLRTSPAASAAAEVPRAPVLVELFTSEGCSSCPPADALLKYLAGAQPVEGAEIVPLALHVDYWNRLGWKDPYSSGRFSQRQSDYASAMKSDRIYTPQMVVDGSKELLGSDEARAKAAIAESARAAKVRVDLTKGDAKSGAVALSIRVTPRAPAEVFLAITEDGLASSVARGENAGKRLEHTGVVRELVKVGSAKAGEPFVATKTISLERDWNPRSLSAVAFVQERDGRRVVGVARVGL